VHKEVADLFFGEAAAVDVHIHHPVVDLEDHKVQYLSESLLTVDRELILFEWMLSSL
jgi:hypothetical protein